MGQFSFEHCGRRFDIATTALPRIATTTSTCHDLFLDSWSGCRVAAAARVHLFVAAISLRLFRLLGFYVFQLGFRLIGRGPRIGCLLLHHGCICRMFDGLLLPTATTLPRIATTASTSHDRYLVN
jgi:hypothetical protein